MKIRVLITYISRRVKNTANYLAYRVKLAWSESTHNYAYAMYENIFGDEFRKYIDDKGKAYFDRITVRFSE